MQQIQNLNKKISLFAIFILMMFGSSCKQNNRDKIQLESNKAKKDTSQTLKKEAIKPIEIKTWDSLNRYNAEKFLIRFGKENPEKRVKITTKFGEIIIKLFDETPIHRANFIFLTKANYFDKTVFYRIAKNFVIQGGNSDRIETQIHRNKYGNYKLEPEFRENLTHKYGAVAAVREWDDNPFKLSTPFEFYIVQKRDGAHHLNNEHTVFGQVISGFETMDKLNQVNVGSDEWPLTEVKMTVEILD